MEGIRALFIGRTRFERLVIFLWVLGLSVIIVRLAVLKPGSRTLFPIYRDAGINWVEGVNLYPEEVKGPSYALYRYSPIVAASFAPFSILPSKVGDAIWRFINAGVLIFGMLYVLQSISRSPITRAVCFAMMAIMFPTALPHLSNGQCNALVIGLVLIAFGASSRQRWNLSAFCLTVATLLKLYPIAAALLLIAIHPRQLGLRFALAMALGAAAPFVLQNFDYVLHQYQLWAKYAVSEDRSKWGVESANVDFQMLVNVWIRPISQEAYRLIEVAVGGLMGLIVMGGRIRGVDPIRLCCLALGFASVWMTVFGPATESPTYLILMPCVAWGIISTRVEPVNWLAKGCFILAFGMLLGLQISGAYGPLFSALRLAAVQPMAGLIFTFGLMVQFFSQKRQTQPIFGTLETLPRLAA